MFSDLSPGMPFWQPPGTHVWNELTGLWRTENVARGYTEVRTPILYDVELWKQSGHWDKYKDNMYFTDVEGRPMGLKPMNCPAHIQIYKDEPPLLPRPARALRRAGPGAPPRAERHAPRAAARALDHPGRRAHLLHRGPDRGRGAALPRLRLLPLRRCSASSRASSCPPGPTTASGATRRGTTPRARSRRRCGAAGSSTRSARARAPSTARRSTCTSPTRSAAAGSSAPCSSTT